MPKITKNSNYRVIVEPKGLGNFGSVRVSDSLFYKTEEARQKEYKNRCEEIVDQIKRHVDNIGRVDIDFDSEDVCSFCGRCWEDDDETGEPTCCTPAVDEYRKLNPATS